MLIACFGRGARAGIVPRYEPMPCPDDVDPTERVDCGALVVPETRALPASREIRLPVRIFRTRSAAPAPDPLVFVPGGPGGSAAGRRSGRELPFLDERDYVLLEPRGSRLASPSLACPEVNALKGEIAAGRLRGTARRQRLARAAADCRAALVRSGIDLGGYTTAALADDLEDLRRLLGYERWNLFGLSYGTRVVLSVLARHPAGVRSAVLDSVLPPEVSFDESATANLRRSLNAVFDGCAADPECGSALPGLRPSLDRLIARADRRPLPLALSPEDTGGSPAQIRGAEVVAALYGALHEPEAIGRLPRIVAAAAAGDYALLTPLVRAAQGASRFVWGLRYSIWCADEAPFEDASQIAAQLSPDEGLGGIDETTASAEECRAWDVAASPASENEPVRSDVPVLVFAGEFDPDTPPAWGRRLLTTLPNARYVEMPGRSHGASFSRCGGEITSAFLRDPSAALPVDCALRDRGADFARSARSGPAP